MKIAAILVGAVAVSAHAGITQFTADINGANEVPGNASPATGVLTGTYDDVSNQFAFSWSITDNLLGNPTSGAHIHFAPPGQNGGVQFGFAGGAWALDGNAVWTGLSAANIQRLIDGNLYVNFHTSAFPGGEVRGQIVQVPAPAAPAVLGGLGLVAARRRRR